MRVSVMTPKCRRGGGQVHEEERGSLAETLDSILDRKHCDWRTNQLRLSRCLFGDPDLIVAIIFVTMATIYLYKIFRFVLFPEGISQESHDYLYSKIYRITPESIMEDTMEAPGRVPDLEGGRTVQLRQRTIT
ncbi:unnamed protein product [Nezara viridula]|uniref:Uncharacterized protein n=1 Tax=Nezara viridula TaxID=85310 RepID=A0A9P0H6H8_NEZVI|nr:unnamed protein product [Nezara viridula]